MIIAAVVEYDVEIVRHPWGGIEAVARMAPKSCGSSDPRVGSALLHQGRLAFHPINEWRFFPPELIERITAELNKTP